MVVQLCNEDLCIVQGVLLLGVTPLAEAGQLQAVVGADFQGQPLQFERGMIRSPAGMSHELAAVPGVLARWASTLTSGRAAAVMVVRAEGIGVHSS